MKYYEVVFHIDTTHELMSDAYDMIAALAGEAGFESFEETQNGLKGYVQQSFFNQEQLDTVLQLMPFDQTTISYEVTESEDKDWNEQWEHEGFEPIIVDNRCVIHDGRHLPTNEKNLLLPSSIKVEIDAKLAFGTGTHETTRMIVSMLLGLEIYGKAVLDCGCGTGILGIVALKLGAKLCIGYDIDEWSVNNARHNAIINNVDERFTPFLGDATLLDTIDTRFDIVLANINRNILLNDMPHFRKKMLDGALLVLSGFYTEDIPLLTEKAQTLGLSLKAAQAENNWACLVLE